MNILVTGSTGFIGSHLCRALIAAGHRVRAFHRSTSSLRMLVDLPLEHVIGDLTQPETIPPAMEGIEAVFHVAAFLGGKQPGKHYAITVEGTRRLARAALDAGVRRLVHTSSIAALGLPEPGCKELLDENHTWNSRPEAYPYGYAKYLAEMEIQKAVAQGLDAVIVNPSLVYGPGDVYRQSSSPLLAAARGKIPVSVEGGVNVVHIEDVVAGHLAALEQGKTGRRYILGGANMPLHSMVLLAARITGVRPPALILPGGLLRFFAAPLGLLQNYLDLPVPVDLFYLAGLYFYFNTARARLELGLSAPRPAEEAIRAALDWFLGT